MKRRSRVLVKRRSKPLPGHAKEAGGQTGLGPREPGLHLGRRSKTSRYDKAQSAKKYILAIASKPTLRQAWPRGEPRGRNMRSRC